MCFVSGIDISPEHESGDSSIQETLVDIEDGNKTGNDRGEDENDASRPKLDNIKSKCRQRRKTSQYFN